MKIELPLTHEKIIDKVVIELYDRKIPLEIAHICSNSEKLLFQIIMTNQFSMNPIWNNCLSWRLNSCVDWRYFFDANITLCKPLFIVSACIRAHVQFSHWNHLKIDLNCHEKLFNLKYSFANKICDDCIFQKTLIVLKSFLFEWRDVYFRALFCLLTVTEVQPYFIRQETSTFWYSFLGKSYSLFCNVFCIFGNQVP